MEGRSLAIICQVSVDVKDVLVFVLESIFVENSADLWFKIVSRLNYFISLYVVFLN